MQVALMTWFQHHNYGTALQAYALYNQIQTLGYNVDVVDYVSHPNNDALYALPIGCYVSNKAISFAKNSKRHPTYRSDAREKLFDTFLHDRLTFTDSAPTLAELEMLNDCYDTFVCGSDQIWNPDLFDPHYYLDFAGESKQTIAYAPSMGVQELRNPPIGKKIASLASKINCLSTRESAGSSIISELTNRDVATVLDPTLLISGFQWKEVAGKALTSECEKPYLLIYMLGSNDAHLKTSYTIAETLNLEPKLIPVYARDLERRGCLQNPVGPSEFVSLIANANYVCTDSFHGTAFAINFEREFSVFKRFKSNDPSGQNSRVFHLLNITGLSNRIQNSSANIDAMWDSIDWDSARDKLEVERYNSIGFLRESLTRGNSSLKQKNHVFRDRSLCCGCGACSSVCPVSAISIDRNAKGFDMARVDEGICISCSKCRVVCPFAQHGSSKLIREGEVWSYKDHDHDVLMRSSSGGAAYRLSIEGVARDMNIIGSLYDPNSHRVCHEVIAPGNLSALARLQGSKYAQSSFSRIARWVINANSSAIIFGTPCQIAAMRNLAPASADLLFVDLICHGVPSSNLIDRYTNYLVANQNMNIDGLEITFRYKPRGWHQKHIHITDGNREIVYSQSKDPYLLMFEHRLCYNDCCYECPWRDRTAADIRLGDYWGARFRDDQTGVSMAIVMTERGSEWLAHLEHHGDIQVGSVEDYFLNQQVVNVSPPLCREAVMDSLAQDSADVSLIARNYARPFERNRKANVAIGLIKASIRGEKR